MFSELRTFVRCLRTADPSVGLKPSVGMTTIMVFSGTPDFSGTTSKLRPFNAE